MILGTEFLLYSESFIVTNQTKTSEINKTSTLTVFLYLQLALERPAAVYFTATK